ncbi:DUF1214 domain-containing protein [Microbaculum marinum]|uniref:DUF1214 domain-containing protein n=1 Tax=Microbaculum marinum TaxID=1764581 RepID=A0AAW9RKD2_9HYPH
MQKVLIGSVFAFLLTANGIASAQSTDPVKVTIDNFVRAQSDTNMAGYVKRGALGKFLHERNMVNADDQIVIRSNVDTLYSLMVVDLTTPVTIYMPDSGGRFQSLECLSEEHSIQPTVYGPGYFTFTREQMGTRYAFCNVRTFADPNDADDMKAAHALQDQIKAEQANTGEFQIPNWDQESLASLRELLQKVAQTRTSTRGYFGIRHDLNQLYWTLGAAAGWGGNPEEAAVYSVGLVANNDGKTPYMLHVPKDVPVEAFWSVTLYNAEGYLPKTKNNVYSFNSVTAKPNEDGTFTISFGGDGPNKFEIMEGWNYLVRMYRPKQELIDGHWRFPEAVLAN